MRLICLKKTTASAVEKLKIPEARDPVIQHGQQ